MKTGKNLQELAAELERQSEARKDYVAPQGAISMEMCVSENTLSLAKAQPAISGLNGEPKYVNDFAHGQIASSLGVPKAYYDRMREEAPTLLCDNVNTWLKKEPKKMKLVRTLDGNVRALLSDRYRPLDNYDLVRTALPALTAMKAEIKSCEVTETRLYLKAIFPQLSAPVPTGVNLGEGHDRINLNVAALVLTNSEVGASSLRVEAGVFTAKCTNLAIFDGSAMKKYHVGRSAATELDSAVELFTNETRQADDRAFWLKVRDVIAGSCNAELFNAQMEKIQAAAKNLIASDDLPKVIEVTAKRFSIGDGVEKSILKHLIQGGDLTQWGLMSAVTRASADVEDYDVATDLEHIGGKILELPKSDWNVISQAA